MVAMSFTPAKIIDSPQSGLHERLDDVVSRHLKSEFRKPVADYSQQAFEKAYDQWCSQGRPELVLDSACGTAESSRFLAAKYDNSLVIGLDQSAKRLGNSQNRTLPENCLLLGCECTDFWRLAEKTEWHFQKHYLLYPNPWSKPQHLQRRWHGHLAFLSLLAISPRMELRTNWQIYAEEFHQSLVIAGRESVLSPYATERPMTAFERKYLLSEHPLWQVSC